MEPDYRQSLDDLERAVRVPRDQQSETQDADPPREYVDPEDLGRLRLLSDPAGLGRLEPRQ
jgi:hypothetical protein